MEKSESVELLCSHQYPYTMHNNISYLIEKKNWKLSITKYIMPIIDSDELVSVFFFIFVDNILWIFYVFGA